MQCLPNRLFWNRLLNTYVVVVIIIIVASIMPINFNLLDCNPTTTCSGNGTCNPAGICVCQGKVTGNSCDRCLPDYYGKDCSTSKSFSFHYINIFPICRLNLHLVCIASSTCSGNGTCDASGKCVCHEGFSGNSCNSCKQDLYGRNCSKCIIMVLLRKDIYLTYAF